MYKQELISVIVPVYNVEKYLRRCIDSIVNQTYKNLEIILVDDGSPDKCGKICDEYAQKDRRIMVIHQANQGVSAARNHGIESSNGEFIAFVDSDDFIDEDYIETLFKNIHNSDIISCNFKICYSDNASKRSYKMPSQVCIKTSKAEFFSDCIDSMIYTYVIWGKLYRKDVLKNIRFKNQAYSEDALFVREVFLNCGSMRLIPYDGYNYFIGEQNVTGDITRVNEKLTGALNMLLCTLDMCKRNEININYIIMEKQITDLLKGILKHCLRHYAEISIEICRIINTSLPTIKSFQSIKHIEYLKICCAARIVVIINCIKHNQHIKESGIRDE